MEAKPAFVLASKGGSASTDVDLKGTVFGAVDCDVEEELCQDFNIKKYPTFAYMPGNVKDVVPDEYTGERDAEESGGERGRVLYFCLCSHSPISACHYGVLADLGRGFGI